MKLNEKSEFEIKLRNKTKTKSTSLGKQLSKNLLFCFMGYSGDLKKFLGLQIRWIKNSNTTAERNIIN